MRKRLNLIDEKFGKLTVIEFAYMNMKRKNTYWLCKCDCGNKHIVRGSNLTNNEVKSCGCSQTFHKLSGTRFYNIWKGIKTRCLNKNHSSYKSYGKKGIKICDEWLNFENFKKDMYKSYLQNCKICGEKNTTIDRINSKKDYEPKNCRWATIIEQSNNKKFILVKKDYLDKILIDRR